MASCLTSAAKADSKRAHHTDHSRWLDRPIAAELDVHAHKPVSQPIIHQGFAGDELRPAGRAFGGTLSGVLLYECGELGAGKVLEQLIE
jgi:hypothetical protein